MSATISTLHPLRMLLTLVLALALTGCVETLSGPEIEDEIPEPEPEPQYTTVYDLDLTTRYLEVVGSCDVDIRGPYANGEFQYRYEVSGEGQKHTRESNNYDSRFGETFSRQPEETINFTNQTFSWRSLSESAVINIKLSAVEWDGAFRDSRMNDASYTEQVPLRVGKRTLKVGVGSGMECAISLVYDAVWTERRVYN